LRSITKINSPSSVRHNLQSNKTHQKHKHIRKKIGAIESPRYHQFSQQAKLRFVAFIHRKHLTLFLGYNITKFDLKKFQAL
jgi:hypothetical protein